MATIVGMTMGAVREGAQAQLQRLVRLPKITVEGGFHFDPAHGFTALSDRPLIPRKIAELTAELDGTFEDAARWYRLGELFDQIPDRAKSQQAYRNAVERYEAHLGSRTGDGRLLTRFGLAVWASGDEARAESLLREAVKAAPDRWECWVGLGRFLNGVSTRALLPGRGPAIRQGQLEIAPALARAHRLESQQIEDSQKALAEAQQCFDRAVEAAPEEPPVYLHRGMHASFRSFQSKLLEQVRAGNSQEEGFQVLEAMFTTEALADFERAIDLDSTDYHTIATAALFEAFGQMVAQGRHGAEAAINWDLLPEGARRSIREKITLLENLGQSADPERAAPALEALAMLQSMILQDVEGSIRHFRRAIVLDPGREQSWDLLTVLLAKPASYDELRSLCERRLKTKDSARNRILLAKAYERLHQFDQAEIQARVAVRMSPDDFTANLSLAALFLRRADQPVALIEAGRYLAKVNEIKDKDRQQLVEFILALSIYYVFQDKTDDARQMVSQVLQLEAENEYAREIMEIIR